MSEKYLPLFRKYRPQSFSDVVGQENLVKALGNAIALNRIANAYLFCGPRGTGKTSSARIMAKSLNCVNGPTLEPCQKCPSCLDITNACGLDVIEIDAATNRGIDDAKDLIAQVQYAPMNGKYKIFIIDEVHMLSNEAFNALLKTFEEPPANVIFILATTEPHKVIETIVSRCQRFDLRRITTNDIVSRLRYIADIENIKINDDALFAIAKNVSGGLRDSLALLDQVSILGAKETIEKETIEGLLGKVTFDVLFDLITKILNNDVISSLHAVENTYTKGLEPKNLTENFIEFLRNLVFTLNTNDDEAVLRFSSFNLPNIQSVRAYGQLSQAKITQILNTVIEYYKEIKYATNPYLWVELMIIALCNTESGKEIIADSAKASVAYAQVNPAEIVQQAKSMVQSEPVKPVSAPVPVTEVAKMQPVIQELAKVEPALAPGPVKVQPEPMPMVEKPAVVEPQAPQIVEPAVATKDSSGIPKEVMAALEGDFYEDDAPVGNVVEEKPMSVEPVIAQAQVENAVSAPSAAIQQVKDEIPAPPLTVQQSEESQISPSALLQDELNPEPQFVAEAPRQPKTSDGAVDSVTAWADVLSAIESVPAKFFYSGVAKLVGVEGNKLVIGFVNENALSQAKSDSKLNHLIKSVKTMLGDSFSPELILINKNTKVMDIKMTAKVQPQKQSMRTYTPEPLPEVPSLEQPMAQGNAQAFESPSNKAGQSFPSEKRVEMYYSQKTKEMLDAFNGKIVD